RPGCRTLGDLRPLTAVQRTRLPPAGTRALCSGPSSRPADRPGLERKGRAMADLVTSIPALDPDERLLCGPGPSNVHPDVIEAMRLPMNGHLDPDFWDILVDLVSGLQALWQSSRGLSICLSSSGTSAMEAGFLNLIEPGDTVISCHWGFFGSRLNDFAHRIGADVVELTADFGQLVSVERVMETLASNPNTRIVSVVHAETSTGV